MSKGFDQNKGKSPPAADRRKQAAEAKENSLANYKKAKAERQERIAREDSERRARPTRDVSRNLDGLRRVPFSQLDRTDPLHPSPCYEKIVSHALETINNGSRRAILCWPRLTPSPAAVAAMLMLGDCEACDPIQTGQFASLTAPWGLRALIYPYARTAHRPLRHIYVEKIYLHTLHIKHQIRSTDRVDDAALADFHRALARVHTLANGRGEFANPCLDELLPSGPCSGTDGRSELLWRIRTKIDLNKLSPPQAAENPATAKFYLFGIRANENLEAQLKALKNPPNLILLQLDGTARRRLGRNWEARIKTFLAAAEARFQDVAVIALTDDPWTFDRVRFDTLFTKPKRRKDPPYPSDVIFSTDNEIVTDSVKVIAEFAPIKNCSVSAYAGESAALLKRLRTNRLRASQAGDNESADRVGAMSGIVRRCTSLPGSRAEFSDYLIEERGAIIAAEHMTDYRVGSLTKDLQESFGAWPQLARSELTSMCQAVHDVWDRTDALTPMKPMLRDLITRFLNNSSRTVFLFPNDMMADFAAHVLKADTAIGQKVTARIENGMVRFLDRYGLDDLDGLERPERNYFKTLVVVAPSRAAMLDLLTKPWLPENVIVLSDADTLERTARDTDRLSSYPELNPLKLRFEAFTKKAREEAARVNGVAVSLDLRDEPQDDDDEPTTRIVNLAGKVRENQTLLSIELIGGQGAGQIVIAKPGTRLVVQDKSQVLPIYKEVMASELAEGDRLCVIGDAFVEMARPLVNITRRAAEEIRDYHEQVEKRFAALPGDSVQARLRSLVDKMCIPGVQPARAHYWIDLEEQLNASLDDVVPRAPIDFPTFEGFMKALGLTGKIVERYWTWAVVAQRSHKLKAGMGMRDAFRGILVDTYSAQSDNPTRLQELRLLRAAAENFVGVIRKIETIKAENVGT